MSLTSGCAVIALTLASGCSRDATADREGPPRIVEASDPTVVEVEHPDRFALVRAELRAVPNELHANGVRSVDGVPLLHREAYYTLNYLPRGDTR